MSTREKLLAATLSIFLVCLVVWVVRTTPKTPPPQEKIEPPTVMEYEGNTIIEEHDGRIIWELTCDKMRVDTITQNIEIDGVYCKFHQRSDTKDAALFSGKNSADAAVKDAAQISPKDSARDSARDAAKDSANTADDSANGTADDDEKIWELTAVRGIYFQSEKNIHVEGDVKVTNSDGAELVSDEINWFGEQELLVAAGKVLVTNSDGAKLSGDTVNWFTAEDRLVATGNVKISKDDMRAFGDMAYSNDNFKHFGLWGHAKILKGVKEEVTDDDEKNLRGGSGGNAPKFGGVGGGR